MKQVFINGSHDDPSTTDVEYSGVNHSGFGQSRTFNTSNYPREGVIPYNGYIRNLRVVVDDAPGSGNSWTCRLFRNGADADPSVTISDSDTDETDSTEQRVFAGDRVCFKVSPASSPSATSDIYWSFEYESDVGQRFITMASLSGGITTGTLYEAIHLQVGQNTLQGQHELVAPLDCTLRDFYVFLNSRPGGSGAVVRYSLYVNGTEDTSTRIEVTDPDEGLFCLNDLAVRIVKGDIVILGITVVSGTPDWPGTSSSQCAGFGFEPDIDGQSWLANCNNVTIGLNPGNTDEYVFSSSYGGATPGSIQNRVLSGPTSWTLKNFHWYSQDAPSAGDATATSYFDGTTAGNCSVTFDNTTGVFSDLVNSDSVVNGDYLSVFMTTGGSWSGNHRSHWSFVQYIEPDSTEDGNIGIWRRTTGGTAISGAWADFDFDEEVKLEGEFLSAAGVDDDKKMPAGKVLVMYNMGFDRLDTANSRTAIEGRLMLNAVASEYGLTCTYQRNNGGHEDTYMTGAAILDVATAGHILKAQVQRTDSTSNTPQTLADVSGLQCLKIPDHWNYFSAKRSTTVAMGIVTGAPITWATLTGSGNWTDAVWDTPDEEDTGFDLVGGAGDEEIQCPPSKLFLSYGVFAETGSSRRGLMTRVQVREGSGGSWTDIDYSFATGYMRNSNGVDEAWANWYGLIDLSGYTDPRIKIQFIENAESGSANYDVTDQYIQMVELPNDADYIFINGLSADNSAINQTFGDVSWKTTADEMDTDSFGHPSNTEIRMVQGGKYMFFSQFASNRSAIASTRKEPQYIFRVETTDQLYGRFSKFNRGDQGTKSVWFGAYAGGFIYNNHTKDDDLILREGDETSNNNGSMVIEEERSAVQGVHIPSLFKSDIQIDTGTYEGDGTNNRAFTGIGFKPKVIFIFPDEASSNNGAYFFTEDMATDNGGQPIGENGWDTGEPIASFDTDGFTIGTDTNDRVNEDGSTYYYVALGGDGIETGTYTGDGAATQAITGVGFRPEWLVLGGNNTSHSVHKLASSGYDVDQTHYFSIVDDKSNFIESLDVNGFTVGSDITVNQNTTKYYYAAFKKSDQMRVGGYNGDGNDDRRFHCLPWQPDFMIVKKNATVQAAVRTNEQVGDLSLAVRANTVASANKIQEFLTDGFELGTDAEVNSSGSNQIYHFVAFTGVVGITTTEQTIQARARILVNQSETIQARARMFVEQSETIQARARIKVPQSEIIRARARILVGQSETIQARSRIKNTIEQTVTARARMLVGQEESITAQGRIIVNQTQTIQGRARILKTISQTVEARARIFKEQAETIQARARIVLTGTETIEARARILKEQTETITARGRIFKEITQTIQAKARVVLTETQTIQAQARILVVQSETIQARARVFKTISQTAQARARVVLTNTDTITARARILVEQSATIEAQARIKNTISQTIEARARILTTTTQTITARGRILVLQSATITARARILVNQSQTVTARARILATMEDTIQAKANIILPAITKTIDAKARIFKEQSETLTAHGRILVPQTETITARARVFVEQTETIQGRARIFRVVTQTVQAQARIAKLVSQTIQAKASIWAVPLGVVHGVRGPGNVLGGRDRIKGSGKRGQGHVLYGKNAIKGKGNRSSSNVGHGTSLEKQG